MTTNIYIYKHTIEFRNARIETTSSYKNIENCDFEDMDLIIDNECVMYSNMMNTFNDMLYSMLQKLDIDTIELKQLNELVGKYNELYENDEIEENEDFIKYYNDITLSFLKKYHNVECIGSLHD